MINNQLTFWTIRDITKHFQTLVDAEDIYFYVEGGTNKKDKYNVLVLDCNKDFENDEEQFNILYKKLKQYILNLKPYDYTQYMFRDKKN